MSLRPDRTRLHTTRAPVTARWVVNAAGLGADYIDAVFGYHRFTVTPRRGELIVYDKLARALIDKIVLPVPTVTRQGRVGQPDHLRQRHARPDAGGSARPHRHRHLGTGFEFLLDKGRTLMPRLLDEEVTATYAGLRAATDHDDYLIESTPPSATCSSAASAPPD